MIRGLLIAVAAVVGVWLVAILVLIALGRKSAARELAGLIPNLVVLFRGLLGDPRVPRSSKRWLWFAVAWFLSPLDLIHVLRRTDRTVLADHWRGDPATLDAVIRLGQRNPSK